MINVNELRIGNWINFIHSLSEVIIIDGANKTITTGDGQHYNASRACDDYGPVHLTDEWLVKFGFDFFCGDWCKNGIKIGECEENEGETCYKLSINEWIEFEAPPIFYVHQLQNLYFALTGQELTINPDKTTR